jgi:hypothetical protein
LGVSENFALKAKAPLGDRQKLITLTRAVGGDSAHVWGADAAVWAATVAE